MTKTKKYRLLKDLPNVDKGAVFEFTEGDKYFVTDKYGETFYLYETVVTEQTDWFSPFVITSFDNVDLFIGDKYWTVFDKSFVDAFGDDVEKDTIYGEHTLELDGESFVHYVKVFSKKEKAQEYLDSLKPKFKVGDIVKSFEKGFVFKVKSLLDNYLVVDKESDNTTPDIVKAEICRLATEQEIIKHYEQQGWVKGVTFKCINKEKDEGLVYIFDYMFVSKAEYVKIISNRNYKLMDLNIEDCELIKEPVYPKSFKDLEPKNHGINDYDNIESFINNQDTFNFGYYIGEDSRIYKSGQRVTLIDVDENIFSNKSQAQSALAFAQLTQLHKAMIDEYCKFNGCDWKPDWNDKSIKEVIIRKNNKLVIYTCVFEWHPLPFPRNSGLVEFSLEHHNDLWKQYFEL